MANGQRSFVSFILLQLSNNNYYYDSEDVWMPYGSLSSQPGASNVAQAAPKANNSRVSKVYT